jgi:hypothetical protein
MKIVPICCVLVWTTIAVAIGAPNRQIAFSGFCSIDGGRTKIPFAIEATLTPYNPKIHTGRYFGTDGGGVVVSYVCSAFAVSIGGRDISIPEKAYSDLGDITSITPVAREGNQWAVTISGGNGGGSYEFDFIFDSERLLERRLLLPEEIIGPNAAKGARRNRFNQIIMHTEKY